MEYPRILVTFCEPCLPWPLTVQVFCEMVFPKISAVSLGCCMQMRSLRTARLRFPLERVDVSALSFDTIDCFSFSFPFLPPTRMV